MKEMKRILALVLCFVMLVGLVPPAEALTLKTAGTTNASNAMRVSGSVIDAAIFCSDVHTDTSAVSSVFKKIAGSATYTTATFCGDTYSDGSGNSSDVTGIAQTALGNTSLQGFYVWGDHDDASDIVDDSGLVYGSGEDENYYIYVISMADMDNDYSAQEAAAEMAEFTAAVAAMDKTKPLFIASHQPLHARRSDNVYAEQWVEVINAAGAVMDVVFLWGHNHTGDGSVDQAVYYVEKGSSLYVETLDGAENASKTGTSSSSTGTTVEKINFTYMNAGYIGKSGGRGGYATTVLIYADAMVFQDYNSSGAVEDNDYTHNVEVEREFATPTTNTVTDTEDTTQDVVTAVGTGLTGVTLTVSETADTSAFQSDCVAYDVALEGYTEGSTVTLTFDIGYMTSTDLVVYANGQQITPVSVVDVVEEDGFYSVQVTVEATAAAGTYVFGKLAAAEDAVLTGMEIASLPTTTAYTVMDEINGNLYLDITGLVVNAVYDNEQKIELEWDRFGEIEGGYTLSFDLSGTGEKTVTVTYGEYTKTFTVTVYEPTYTDAAEAVAEYVAEAVKEGYVARDIELTGYTDGENVRVVMTAPEGANVVYHVEENGTLTEIEGAEFENGVVVFTADRFSPYVVGESGKETEIEVPDPETATGSGTTTTDPKTVYVLTNSPSAGSSYLIVNGSSAGSYYALANNNGSAAATGVTVVEDDTIGTYIELADATDELWTVGGSYTFQNGSYYLGYSEETTDNGYWEETTSEFALTTTARTWSYSSSRLSISAPNGWNNSTYYLRYNAGWTWTSSRSSATNIYFYVPTTIPGESTTVSGTYSIEGEFEPQVVTGETESGVTAVLYFTPEGGVKTEDDIAKVENLKFEIVNDDADIIKDGSFNETTGEFIFSGNYGKALVKISGETEFGAVSNYVVVEALAPYYTVELCDPVTVDGTTTYEPITAPVALKGIEAGDTYSVWAVVKEYDGVVDENGEDGVDLGDVEDSRLYWSVSNTGIATIDPTTGVITFTGNSYGTFEVTVHYLDENGESLCEDTITISATESQYVVPGDGTDDFPEYPDQGAVRFDKTAVAQGNFSETGIAKVELSMTGVPYTTDNAMDVVLMLDTTGSMSDDGLVAMLTAAGAFVDKIVINEDGSFNDNHIAVYFFNSEGTNEIHALGSFLNEDGTVNTTDYNAVKTALNPDTYASNSGYDFSSIQASGGTPFDEAAQKCHDVLADHKSEERQQFCVFMSDGGPTSYKGSDGYTYYGGNNTSGDRAITSYIGGYTSSTSSSWTYSLPTEYWTDDMKADGVTVYTVGLLLQNAPSNPSPWSNMTDSTMNDDNTAITTMGSHYYFTSTILKNMATDTGKYIDIFDVDNADDATAKFTAIAQSILEAATDVVVEDKIDSHYTMNFSLPTGVTSGEAGMSEFYIQVVDYVLDSTTHERTGVYSVLENFTFNADGSLKSHTVDGVACSDCTHVTTDGTTGAITAIDGTYFDYTTKQVTNEAGETVTEEYLNWNAEKLTSTELALQYFVYLENSAGDVDAADQVAPGTYPTNEYATLTYTNYNGNQVQQEFPVPTMTWMGAQVTYVFYLVNDAGQPVNRAGKVVPFAEAVYVTTPVTYDVTWNEEAGSENILAKDIFASAGVPDVYKLYDETANYVIRVYQTETVDSNGKNGNYFQIIGATDKLIDSDMDTDTTVDNSTTKVFNTKSGIKYDEYGIYSVYAAGTILTDGTNDITTTVKADNIDYANTTVAFAVVWKPELAADTVVVDYGLDVVIDVITNDNMAAGVVGVRTDAPSGVTTDGTYTRDEEATLTEVDVYIDADHDAEGLKELKIGTATVENLTSVRFSLDSTNGMQFSAPAEFYYEADVNYYTYDSEGTAKLNTTSMYASVTVIPATTIYYEDEYVILKTYTDPVTVENEDGTTTTTYTENNGWSTVGSTINDTQDQDRPGESKISADLDADNNYGFDEAYSSMSQYSLGSAAMVNVTTGKYATATFDFWGTGFDIISLTSATTGHIVVNVYPYGDTSNPVQSETVNTYYGYKKVVAEDGTVTWEKTASDDSNALYQVPVMKIGDGQTSEALTYGHYTAVITVSYIPFLDQNKTDSGYNFYLDAIRIYNPTGNVNDEANDAYEADGEGYPEYFEVRDQIIAKSTFDSLNDETISGIVFIDGGIAAPSISDYTSYGPNNETYLANGQAIAFDLNATSTVDAGMNLAKVQLAVKTVGGTGKVEVYGVKADGTIVACLNETISTATDMYYDITALEGMTVVIKSTGNAVISITNVKVTSAPVETNAVDTASVEETEELMLFSVRRSTAEAALATMTVEEDVPATTVPEEPTEEPTETPTEEPTEAPTEEPTEAPTEEPEETEPSAEEQVKEVIEKISKIIRKIFGRIFG